MGVAPIVLAVVLAPTRLALAHPSDFRTLTLDFLVGQEGLEVIDAAVVPAMGPGYEPVLSEEEKHAIAVNVLNALSISAADVVIDADMSNRYHEVGFAVRFSRPLPSSESPLRIQSERLQQITRDVGLERLKLGLCAVADEQSSLPAPDVEATEAGRLSDPDSNERAGCMIWEIAPTDPSISIRLQPTEALAQTGSSIGVATAGLMVLLVGLVLFAASRTRSSPDLNRGD